MGATMEFSPRNGHLVTLHDDYENGRISAFDMADGGRHLFTVTDIMCACHAPCRVHSCLCLAARAPPQTLLCRYWQALCAGVFLMSNFAGKAVR